MVKIPVCLNNMTDAKHLVQIAEGCDKDVDESEKDKVYEKLEQMNLLR